MKKNELKKILKPLIKECIKECIFEEGVLSGIVTEVAKGMKGQRIYAEGMTITKSEEPDPDALRLKKEDYEKQRQERIKRLNESSRLTPGVNVFENVTPIPEESSSPSGGSAAGALSGVDPSDPGVDIGGIMNLAGGKWKHLI